jgi:ribosomal protein S18 acetylase RimI-like enzyme
MGAGAASVTLRRAAPEDAWAVADVLIRSRRASVGSIPAAIHSDTEIEQWIKVEVISHREVWVAVATEDHPLAVMVLHDGWIDQLYVDPTWTGLGLGSRLVELAKSRSPQGLQMWTFASNVGAQRFYERHGFVIAETTDGSGNEENQPDFRLVWSAT